MTNILVPRALIAAPDAFGGEVAGDCLRGAPVLRGGRLVGLDPAMQGRHAQMILPRLVEPHCHLDKCHTIHRLGRVGGDLGHALACQRADKVHWSDADIRARATRGLTEARANGVDLMRSHVDWGTDAAPPRAWPVLQELAQGWTGLQLAALIGIDQWADPDFARDVAGTISGGSGVLGAFILDHVRTDAGMRNMFEMAARHGLMLDFHVDEGLGALNGLEQIADMALSTRHDGPILCGHAVSLIDRAPPDFDRIAAKLAQAGITICALPVTNLYLQGRTDGTPDRRGITRVRELRAAGVTVVIGSDNVGDAFCPLGAHDPMSALGLAALTAHLDPPLGDWMDAITTDAARALGQAPVHVDGAPLADLLACAVTHTADLVAQRAPLRPATEILT